MSRIMIYTMAAGDENKMQLGFHDTSMKIDDIAPRTTVMTLYSRHR